MMYVIVAKKSTSYEWKQKPIDWKGMPQSIKSFVTGLLVTEPFDTTSRLFEGTHCLEQNLLVCKPANTSMYTLVTPSVRHDLEYFTELLFEILIAIDVINLIPN
jgi:hypothetical protein